MTNIELYEALKDTIGPEAARMLADHIPPGDIARSSEVQSVRNDVAALERRMDDMKDDFKNFVRAEVAGSQASLVKFMWGFFVPLWLGMLGLVGTMTALVFKL